MRDIDRYSADYQAHYGFEAVLVSYRRRMLLEQLMALRPAVVLEVGCGPESLYASYLQQAAPVNWTVIEPSSEWTRQARAAGLPGMQVVGGFVENSVREVMNKLPRAPDFVICSSVLHEVPSAEAFLAAVGAIMDHHSVLHVNVPNAHSFHRRLAVAMGLIPSVHAMSDRNTLMQQHRVYDVESLTHDLQRAGFAVQASGGYFVKPFTHEQMEGIAPSLSTQVLDGLFEFGKREPRLACEIFAHARLAGSVPLASAP
jgi:2-polyprenyl-3-methyl-5-hydroxy-6-metoxy-1,4-benzoquinol methylase